VVGNKLRSQSDSEFIISNLPDFEFLGFIPYDQAIVEADLANRPLLDASLQVANEAKNIYHKLVLVTQKQIT
jgi:CO dehydrogenase maturation factor